jgi:hypothetical protein
MPLLPAGSALGRPIGSWPLPRPKPEMPAVYGRFRVSLQRDLGAAGGVQLAQPDVVAPRSLAGWSLGAPERRFRCTLEGHSLPRVDHRR